MALPLPMQRLLATAAIRVMVGMEGYLKTEGAKRRHCNASHLPSQPQNVRFGVKSAFFAAHAVFAYFTTTFTTTEQRT